MYIRPAHVGLLVHPLSVRLILLKYLDLDVEAQILIGIDRGCAALLSKTCYKINRIIEEEQQYCTSEFTPRYRRAGVRASPPMVNWPGQLQLTFAGGFCFSSSLRLAIFWRRFFLWHKVFASKRPIVSYSYITVVQLGECFGVHGCVFLCHGAAWPLSLCWPVLGGFCTGIQLSL